ncbi:hypothetical protein [Methyloglobulus sp.]|uniref:hypothetical protein n=1 Tax=Methyloglobulus sp. TaxID=2518622 RepID=UPI0032B79CCE
MAILPKGKSKWLLTLHHGNLGDHVPIWIIWVLRLKVDFVLALNDRHFKWYSHILAIDRIKLSSPYVPPMPPAPTPEFVIKISRLIAGFEKIFVCSGYPTAIYNHLMAIELMQYRTEDLLICCLYGNGELIEEIRRKASLFSNVIICESLSEDDFNYLLSTADLYLRLNSEDSFGIAVADAINLGTTAMATDVCYRYPGTNLINVSDSESELLSKIADIFNSERKKGISEKNIQEFSYSIFRKKLC